MRKILSILLVIYFSYSSCYAQSDDFCNSVFTILRDGPNKFRNIRGSVTDANANATIWSCGVIIPGTISSRFVASMGLFYEGAFIQTKNKEDLKDVYNKYKTKLDSCLLPRGYALSQSDNFYTELSDYKKLVYFSETQGEEIPAKAPPHISLEVAYSKELGFYTIVMYIFEH